MKTRVFLLCFLILSSNFSHLQSEETKTNKFREREATDDSSAYPNIDEDELLNTQCPQHLELRWQTEVSSSVYASPLIADINSDGKLEVVVPSFVHYLEVLEGSDGDKLPGWPAFHQSTIHSSPLLYDIDKDGVREIGLATYNGEVLFFRVSGYLMSDKLEIPRLKVKKNWYVGLNSVPVDRSHPDVHDDQLIQEHLMESVVRHNASSHSGNHSDSTASAVHNETHSVLEEVHHDASSHSGNHNASSHSGNHSDSTASAVHNETHSVVEEVHHDASSHSGNHNASSHSGNHSDSTASAVHNETHSVVEEVHHDAFNASISLPSEVSHDNSSNMANLNNSILSSENEKIRNLENGTNTGRRLLEDDVSKRAEEDVQAATVENEEGLEADADSSFELFRDSDELADEYNYDYDDYVDEHSWDDEEFQEPEHEKVEDYVDIDAHVLCTPVIADIDNDGVSEMIVAVSYFFDHEYYQNSEHLKELGDIEIGKYVSGGIVVFNLDTKQVKWTLQLDLSTDSENFRPYIHSAPTVVDLDGDGNLDILVGTSYGMFYVLDHKGKVRDKFPLAMADIQGAVIAADINDDGKIELVTTDSHGNVAAWTAQGKEIWENHLKSLVPQGPAVGDVDGDGHTDIVVPTVSGNIYVLSGKDGSIIRPYPYRTHGRVMNQVLLVDLTKHGQKKKGLTIVTTSFDGYLYLIDGPTSCADVVDIGETSYSMVLADNVDGGDDLDLIVTTMNGNVFCFSTPSPHHPLKSWRSPNQGRNNAAYRLDREGVYVTPSSRAFRDEEGKSFWVEIEIFDKYRYPSGSQAPYNVTVSLLVPGNYQGDRTIKQNKIFNQPGKYRLMLPTVSVRTAGTVLVEMVDKNGLYFSDDFSLTFHFHYYKLLKWLLVLPMLGMFGVLVILRPQEAMPLPSFTRNTNL
ncbi:hypothetical protein AABB24_015149 [Solanum stoloniferum]|uniref:DEX1 C-terminal domain-containing protein n=1 Tax=Solanum stoloniferum TaxID=62892 RepID=A0ABD2TNK0_9SOLN